MTIFHPSSWTSLFQKLRKLTQNQTRMFAKCINTWISAIWLRKLKIATELRHKILFFVKPTWNFMVVMETLDKWWTHNWHIENSAEDEGTEKKKNLMGAPPLYVRELRVVLWVHRFISTKKISELLLGHLNRIYNEIFGFGCLCAYLIVMHWAWDCEGAYTITVFCN